MFASFRALATALSAEFCMELTAELAEDEMLLELRENCATD
jgi:hypothetical protein